MNMVLGKVHLHYEPRYVIPCVGNITEETFCVSTWFVQKEINFFK
jgi:hypothetical protein